MAIFGTKTKKQAKPKKEAARAATTVIDSNGALSTRLTAPWFSEKALIATERGVYAFGIPKDATKRDVMLAVEKLYKVVPRKIAIVNLPAKRVNLRTRRGQGVKSARRKAYVYLKKGDTISLA
jgi:ribosomal protein L23